LTFLEKNVNKGKEIFYNEGGEMLKQVAQNSGRFPTPGNIEGEALSKLF